MDRRRSAIKLNYRYFIYAGVIIALLQFLALRTFYQEQEVIKLPEILFQSPVQYPEEEFLLEPGIDDGSNASRVPETEEAMAENGEEEDDGEEDSDNGETILTETQKQIVLRLLELVEQDIEYGYNTYPESGYPSDNIWISTDVISVVLNDVGFDLMELIYRDMAEHKEDYPMDIKGSREPIKYIDFRDVFFQEQFFKRNALELPLEFDRDDPNNSVLWQPGDILYFQFDPDNPYKDLGGFVSPRTNDEEVPLVIMISAELETISEVDVLEEYIIVGHYRYPPPEVD